MKVKNRVLEMMKRVRKEGGLPPSRRIVTETFDRLGYLNLSKTQAMASFEPILRDVFEKTLDVLEEYEESAYSEGIIKGLMAEFRADYDRAEVIARTRGFRDGVVYLLKSWYPHLRVAFLSVGQSRKQRGGADFELQIETLFNICGISYHRQEARNRTDLILPSLAVHKANRNISCVISVKRTLRERWAEVAEELFNLRSPNVYLFTADENVTATHVRRICGDYNIYLAVWEEVKAKLPANNLVLSYTEWCRDRLPILKPNW